MLKKIVIALFGLDAVIVVHELGHFVVCKLFHVFTPVFSVGFGPKLIGYKIGNTLFQLALLPLGGYVAIDPVSLATKNYVQKLAINLAGVTFNVIFAFILLAYLIRVMSKEKMVPIISEITPDSPAAKADLQLYDHIIALDHEPITDNTMGFFIEQLRQAPGQTLVFTIERKGYTHDFPITLATYHPVLGPHIGWLGASFKTIKVKPTNWWHVMSQAAATTKQFLSNMCSLMFNLWQKKNRKNIAGPIGIVTGSAHFMSQSLFVLWLAIINLNVAIFNILPIPMLDGGHILFDTIELFYGSPLPAELIQLINFIFFMLLLMFIILISIQDIATMRRKS
jgi:regulator of sigma E protease